MRRNKQIQTTWRVQNEIEAILLWRYQIFIDKTNGTLTVQCQYMDYINNLVDPEKDEGNKNLWRYLKSQKQDHVGVAPLKSDDKLVTDAAGKADILNRQFSSVFTQEQINTMPDKGASPYPNLPKITITRNGVEALLQKVKPKKASGPDIPARFLHEMAEPLSAVLSFIFQQSLDSGTVPDDWRAANVVPIFK